MRRLLSFGKSLEQLRRRYARPNSCFVTVSDTELHCIDEGPRDAPVIVALPAQWTSFTQYDRWAPCLTDAYRILRVDLPGHGLSGPAADDDYSVGASQALLSALLDRLDIRRCALVGPSYAGIIAFGMAADEPARVSALVLSNASGLPRDTSAPRQPNQPPPYPWLAWMEGHYRPQSYFRWKLSEMMPDEPVPPGLAAEMADFNNAPGRIAETQKRTKAYRLGDPQARLAKVLAPTLIQQSDRSTYLPVENAALFARWLTQAQSVHTRIYRGAGHLLIQQRPEETGQDVRLFLDNVLGD